MNRAIITMKEAELRTGVMPVWAASICKDIGGEYNWVNSEGWRPVTRVADPSDRFDYKHNYDRHIAASYGSIVPTYFDVVGVHNKNSTLVDANIHF